MRIGMIGLGRMGGNMVRRLRRAGVEVGGYDRDPGVSRALGAECGASPEESIEALVAGLDAPRVVWTMLPAGAATEACIGELAGLLAAGDVVIDGANSWYRDSLRRNQTLAASGIEFVDAGVSGGIWGLDEGYALMVGGSTRALAVITPVLEALAPAPDRGWLHTGPAGSGHYVKMIHNGIEYGMMQAYAEGFALMRAREDFGLDLAAIAETWRHGSVVRSWLLDLTAGFLAQDQTLAEVEPLVADSGEGRWTALESIEQGIPAPAINAALMLRFASQGKQDYTARLLAMMRNAFGGHAVERTGETRT